ncbi:hypothetical protein ACN20G_32535 (plasmid) [Streptomyces sp. BI20]|uniref:hypothetical protein n=1 Tax=Streptomyces sp. BI20 TaxID=3403460 RepID=UPI003C74C1EB
MSLSPGQHELLALYVTAAGPVPTTAHRTGEPPGGVGDPVWQRWADRQAMLSGALLSLVGRGLIRTLAPRVPGGPERVVVTDAGRAALAAADRGVCQPTTPPGAPPQPVTPPPVPVGELLDGVARARGWSRRTPSEDPNAARLVVPEEGRWLALEVRPDPDPSRPGPLAELTAGPVRPSGTPGPTGVTRPSPGALAGDLPELLHEVDQLWRLLDTAGDTGPPPVRPAGHEGPACSGRGPTPYPEAVSDPGRGPVAGTHRGARPHDPRSARDPRTTRDTTPG